MNYEITDKQKEIRSSMKKVVLGIETVAEDNGLETLKKNMIKLASADYQSIALGDDIVGYCLAAEELAKTCPSTFFSSMSATTAFGLPVNKFGTAEQKRKYLGAIISGTGLGALGVTEAQAGSDLSGMTTTAKKTPTGGFVLNGEKSFVTNAPLADAFLVLAWTNQEAEKEKGMTFFLIDRKAKGLQISEATKTMGLRGAPIANLRLIDCAVGPEAVLGTPGDGYYQWKSVEPLLWLSVSLLALGIGVSCMENSTIYAKGRTAFGKPIGYFEGVGAKLAIMFTMVDLGRMITQRAAWGMERQETEAAILASCAKLFTSEAVNKIADLAMQIFAGHGYILGSKVERLYRDARIAEIVYGTSEMQRAFIAADSLNKFKKA
jgi:alkylation response protein AidB-like acyl-CoA dehydrogenase